MIPYCSHRHSRPLKEAAALLVQDLTVFYSGQEKPALNHFSVTVSPGTVMALVGPNGAGKSTLFKAISGLLPVHSGEVSVFGHSLGACHQRVVYLPQRSEIDWLFPVTVMDLVSTGRYIYLGWFKNLGPKDKGIATKALQQLGIADLAHRHINQLSGGQQQRVLIARALAQNADLFLMDEPFNAIDATTRETVKNVLSNIKGEGKTVIVATHYYDQEEGIYDGAVYLQDGEMIR